MEPVAPLPPHALASVADGVVVIGASAGGVEALRLRPGAARRCPPAVSSSCTSAGGHERAAEILARARAARPRPPTATARAGHVSSRRRTTTSWSSAGGCASRGPRARTATGRRSTRCCAVPPTPTARASSASCCRARATTARAGLAAIKHARRRRRSCRIRDRRCTRACRAARSRHVDVDAVLPLPARPRWRPRRPTVDRPRSRRAPEPPPRAGRAPREGRPAARRCHLPRMRRRARPRRTRRRSPCFAASVGHALLVAPAWPTSRRDASRAPVDGRAQPRGPRRAAASGWPARRARRGAADGRPAAGEAPRRPNCARAGVICARSSRGDACDDRRGSAEEPHGP